MPRARLCLLLFLLAAYRLATAQTDITDHFSDGNLGANPAWQGDTAAFALYGGWLNLNEPPGSGQAYLATAAPVRDTATWSLKLRMDFAPSTQNYAVHMLAADTSDFTLASLSGWYLKIGASGATDGLELWHASGASHSKRFTFLPGALGNRPNLWYRLTRTRTGVWTLSADTGGLGTLLPAGSYTDSLPLAGRYAGLLVGYTTSNRQGIHADDFIIGSPPSQVHPRPSIAPTAAFCAGGTLWLTYPEPLARTDTGALTVGVNGNSRGARATLAADGRLRLAFSQLPDSLTTLQLTLPPGLTTAGGAPISTAPVAFSCLPPVRPGVVMITEVKAGSASLSPAIPASEFVEIYNAAPYPVWTGGLTLADATGTERPLAADTLPAGAYAVICNTLAAPAFAGLGVRVLSQATPLLNDAGDRLDLRSATGALVDSMHYTPANWRIDADVTTLSLERYLPGQGCPSASTWTPCRADAGATPGYPNACAIIPDPAAAPHFTSLSYLGGTELALRFSPLPDTLQQCRLPWFEAAPALPVNGWQWRHGTAIATLAAPPDSAQTYTISLLGPAGCGGALLADTQRAAFGLPRPARPGRIIINEVLHHPWAGSIAFVELYNPTNRFVDVAGLGLATAHGLRLDTARIPADAPALAPGAYVFLCADYRKVAAAYPEAKRANWLALTLPGMDVNDGTLDLLSPTDTLLERLSYNEAVSTLLQDPQGVSLERINPGAPAGLASNWQRCAKAAGFATPGYRNSQYMAGADPGPAPLSAEPQVFSPNADGHLDVTRIVVAAGAGNAGQLRIYDSEGRDVRTLATAQTLPARWEAIWDGRTDNGAAAGSGMYIVLAEVYTPGSGTARHKTTVVIAPR